VWVVTVNGHFNLTNVISALGTNYYDRLSYSSESVVPIMQIRTLMWGITLFAYPIGFCYFNELKPTDKAILICTIVIDILASLNMGISKNIGDIIIIYISCVIISDKKIENKYGKIKKNKKIQSSAFVFLFFLLIFNVIQTARDSVTSGMALSNPYHKFSLLRNTTIFDVMFGRNLSSQLDRFGAYISHGYTGLAYSLELPFVNTYGLGFSRALMEYFAGYLGVFVQDLTYPARIEEIFGWPNGMYWPSAYSWFASSVSFYGLPLLLVLFGILLASVEKRYKKYKDVYSLVLLSQLFIMCIYLPANAQIFQSRASLFGTCAIIFVYLITGRRIKHEIKRKQINSIYDSSSS